MYFDLDPAPVLPSSLRSPPEYHQWLNRTFPVTTTANTTVGAAGRSDTAEVPPPAVSAASTSLMVISGRTGSDGSSSPSSPRLSGTARSGAGGTGAELRSAASTASGGSLVVVNSKAIEDAERLRSGGGGGAAGSSLEQAQSKRAVASVEDFNAAYRKEQKQQQGHRTQQETNRRRDRSRGDGERSSRNEEDSEAQKQHDDLVELMKQQKQGVTNKPSKLAQQISMLQQLQQEGENAEKEDGDDDVGDDETAAAAAAAAQVSSVEAIATSTTLPSSSIFASRDHLGRSFLHCPAALASAEVKRATATKLPSKMAVAYRTGLKSATSSTATTASAAAAGPSVQSMAWVPPHGHLFVAGDISGCCSIYEAVGASAPGSQQQQQAMPRLDRLAIMKGHRAPVKSIAFPASDAAAMAASPSSALGSSSARFVSCSPDQEHPACLWDTETGQAVSNFILSERYPRAVREAGASCCAFVPPGIHPTSGSGGGGGGGGGGGPPTRGDSLVVTGSGSLIVVWDTRAATRVVDLEGHQAPLHHLSFVQYGRGLLSCSEDKTVRLWDLRSSVAVQEFSEAAMHSISHAVEHPVSGELFVQSNDDRVRCLLPMKRRGGRPGVLEPSTGKYRFVKDREFRGHTISGTGCKLALSLTDGGQVLSSGDTFGNLWMYQVVSEGDSDQQQQQQQQGQQKKNNGDVLRKFRAHAKELTVHMWHPIVSGMVVTGSRDGLIKVFK